jgi:hypothetical protein
MNSIYFEGDDILQIQVSDKPIVRGISQGRNTNVSYVEDGSIVEIVLLDAKKKGLLPLSPARGLARRNSSSRVWAREPFASS